MIGVESQVLGLAPGTLSREKLSHVPGWLVFDLRLANDLAHGFGP